LGPEPNDRRGAAPAPSGLIRHPRRVPVLLPGLLALLAALWAGLARIGWDIPPIRITWPTDHGPLFISGFLGTLIGLERAAAMGRPWAYGAPMATGLGALLALAGWGDPAGSAFFTLGSAWLVLVFVVLLRRHGGLHLWVVALGAASWLAGNVLWIVPLPGYELVLFWAAFLVLTIAGERLELSRLFALGPAARAGFAAAIAILLAGAFVRLYHLDLGMRLAGGGMVLLAFWLARYDLARRTVRQSGLTRFMAVCLLGGYVWLALCGVLALVTSGLVAGPAYDAVLHALFVGFVFSMIFGHAPVIFPAVLGAPVAFRKRFYAHLVLLHVTLILRIAGDLGGWALGRKVGGALNAAVLLLFFVSTVGAIVGESRKARSEA
jgi:hypothetical protein